MRADIRCCSKLDLEPHLALLEEIIATGVVVINRPVFEFIVTLAEIRHHGSCVLDFRDDDVVDVIIVPLDEARKLYARIGSSPDFTPVISKPGWSAGPSNIR